MQKFCGLLGLTPVHYPHHKKATEQATSGSFVGDLSREATVITDTEPFHSPVFAASV